MGHAVFISYASADKATAEAACRALEAAAIPCWIAPRDVVAGTRYAEAIVDAIREAQIVVLVFSTAANTSTQVQREVDRATSLGLPILPLRIEEVVPTAALEYYLAGQHWLDALTPPLDEHLAGLVTAVRSLTRAANEEQARLGRPSGDGTAAPHAARRQERKVVTTLICDIVGFTAMSEQADPEDVDRLLEEYSERARQEIETHGGTVEKFIGDAVVGVFGVPAIHEDDPERAIRAGLRLMEALEGMTRPDGSPLQARIGINTGEALVHLDVDPASGRGFLTGDAVNVAARLQAAAPPCGVAVGALTHELTARAIEYTELPPVAAKGKSEPVAAWLAEAPIARLGIGLGREHLTPLVDREAELAYLRSLFEKAVGSSSPAVALIVGEPGIGKSRLVAELLADVDARPELTTWRQGRCVSYGEGVTFWALGEILKAHAGILESDNRTTVEAKLDAVLPEGEDREWFRQRLRALLGLEAAQAEREENFAAWLRFLEGLAASGPAVLVFEDLHWADEALLAFLEFFAGDVDEVPLLLIATTRPQLFEKHPAFAASLARVNRVTLERLSDEETERLVSGLLEPVRAPSQAVDSIIRRSEGNPFYAEESARLFNDKVLQEPARVFESAGEELVGQGGEGAPLPGSVQAVIAARLDTLPPDRKAMVADAAVVGAVFWSGAVAALGRRDLCEVDQGLRCLAGKQFLHRVRSSSMAGESEFVFWHALARDVAYQQLPRAARAQKHAAVAAWIEGKVGDRADDFAEVLAHHYATALDLARAARKEDLATSLVEPAVRYLSLAGDRAINLDVAAAEGHYARALEFAGAESPQRAGLLVRWSEALKQRGRLREAAHALDEAIVLLKAEDAIRGAAVAMERLSETRAYLADPHIQDLSDEAVAMLEDDGPSPEKAEILATHASGLWLIDADPAAATRALDESIAICEQLGLPEPVRALGFRAAVRCDLGDVGGLDDYRRAFAAARAQGLGAELCLLYQNYSGAVGLFEGPRAALATLEEGFNFALRRGIRQSTLWIRLGQVMTLAQSGEWDEALSRASGLVSQLEEAEDTWSLLGLRSQQALLFAHRGEADKAEPFVDWQVAKGRLSEVVWTKAYALLAASSVHLRLGDKKAALELLEECLGLPFVAGEPTFIEDVPDAVRTALGGGGEALAMRIVESVCPVHPVGEHALVTVGALVSERRGECEEAASAFADAAQRWHDFGVPYEEAQALLGQGRCLVALGRAPEAAPVLDQARQIFERLGAKPALAEVDRLHDEITPVPH